MQQIIQSLALVAEETQNAANQGALKWWLLVLALGICTVSSGFGFVWKWRRTTPPAKQRYLGALIPPEDEPTNISTFVKE
ncbi:MAG: hypothetical protein GWP30_11865 [Actinobacteria bacterium]|nr:hypothetical protein [Actinomycetota bacterium]MDG2121403.1 hypothetical protein [Actinomycetota bacterium]NCG41662.1 hypothetical protein [Actinomycetota bacterium]